MLIHWGYMGIMEQENGNYYNGSYRVQGLGCLGV